VFTGSNYFHLIFTRMWAEVVVPAFLAKILHANLLLLQAAASRPCWRPRTEQANSVYYYSLNPYE